eukprot:5751252-Ditylum_brightwellii.AAC.1
MSRPNAHRRKKQNGYKKPQQGQAKIVQKKSIDDYYFYIGSAKQAADYDITSKLCINYIKKTYAYMVATLLNLSTSSPSRTQTHGFHPSW